MGPDPGSLASIRRRPRTSCRLPRLRRTRRAAVEDTMSYANVSPTSSMMAVEIAQEYAIETAAEEEAAT